QLRSVSPSSFRNISLSGAKRIRNPGGIARRFPIDSALAERRMPGRGTKGEHKLKNTKLMSGVCSCLLLALLTAAYAADAAKPKRISRAIELLEQGQTLS